MSTYLLVVGTKLVKFRAFVLCHGNLEAIRAPVFNTLANCALPKHVCRTVRLLAAKVRLAKDALFCPGLGRDERRINFR